MQKTLNQNSKTWPDAPKENTHRVDMGPPPPTGKASIRIRWQKGLCTYEQATEKLHKRFGMTWVDAGFYLDTGVG